MGFSALPSLSVVQGSVSYTVLKLPSRDWVLWCTPLMLALGKHNQDGLHGDRVRSCFQRRKLKKREGERGGDGERERKRDRRDMACSPDMTEMAETKTWGTGRCKQGLWPE